MRHPAVLTRAKTLAVPPHTRPAACYTPPTPDQRVAAMIAYLRSLVLAHPASHERGHAVFVDANSVWIGDAPCGIGSMSTLTVSLRALLGEALRVDARGLILAHSHPSGHCRPSGCDIAATRRLSDIACTLEIALIDHLIFTTDAVYSMRAGGML
ncbi:JAB domain-containing protein [Erythrobacter donghaensis]|uniref:JAB domain-containing protein n=1 Tax=Erythrobacter donghaensis TaxID=267135 RepID=UPI000A35F576|nr:JAB domain-containing protein [Erythrobacter donghaensis]